MTDRHEQETNEMEAPTLEMEATTPGMDDFYRRCVEEMRERRGTVTEPQPEVAPRESGGFWRGVGVLAGSLLVLATAPFWIPIVGVWIIVAEEKSGGRTGNRSCEQQFQGMYGDDYGDMNGTGYTRA